MQDIHNWKPSKIIRHNSKTEEEFLAKITSTKPMIISELSFGFSGIRGDLISITKLPRDVLRLQGFEAVKEAVELAVSRGAKVIGLGGLTSPTSNGGLDLLPDIPKTVTLTNGNAYTASVVADNVHSALQMLNWPKQKPPRIAVVGCTGSVGVPLSFLLAAKELPLLLIGRSIDRVKTYFEEMKGDILFGADIQQVKETPIIVLLTSSPSSRIKPEFVAPNSIIIDCAQPANVLAPTNEELQAQGVSVYEGGIVTIPNFRCNYDLGFQQANESFACLAETYLFARNGIREHSVGRPDMSFATRMERVANRCMVSPRPLASAIR